jgi:hypothetical protein
MTGKHRLVEGSTLVVTYRGTDPHFHQSDPRYPNRPSCGSRSEPGVATPLSRALDSGLTPCQSCSDAEESPR